VTGSQENPRVAINKAAAAYARRHGGALANPLVFGRDNTFFTAGHARTSGGGGDGGGGGSSGGGQRRRSTWASAQAATAAVKKARLWTPPEWAIPPLVVDFLPIW